MKAYYWGQCDVATGPGIYYLWLSLPENAVPAFEQNLTNFWPVWRRTLHRNVGEANAIGGVDGWDVARFALSGVVALPVLRFGEGNMDKIWPAFSDQPTPYPFQPRKRFAFRDTGLPNDVEGFCPVYGITKGRCHHCGGRVA